MSEHPKAVLQTHGIPPKKSLGQNFLFDERVLSLLLDAAQVEKGDAVLEIGAGIGNLTELLAGRASSVLAVEIDQRIVELLEGRVAALPNVQVVRADILELDIEASFVEPFKIVGNLPYYITGAILRRALALGRRVPRMGLTVQAEVARRMVARPGDMSLLAVAVQLYGEARIFATVKAGSFWPRPEVDSAVVALKARPTPLLEPNSERAFFEIVRAGFSRRRKQLSGNLLQLGRSRQEVEDALSGSGVAGSRRAETLSLEEWLEVYRSLSGDVSPAGKP
jgi:16S rRNA (adenine1518-N6/adenine1519-N6)-dimethyltransferase